MGPDRRIKLIFNPHADGGRGWKVASSLQAIIEQHGGASWTATEFPTHATELAVQAAQDGFEVVVAVGGDGTVHEVVNGLMRIDSGRRPPMAVVPIGSGNDFCANAGLATDPGDAVERVFVGSPKSVDLGMVRDGSGRIEYWDNTMGIGFDAATVINSHKITWLRGLAMYTLALILTIVKDFEAPVMKMVIDQERVERELIVLVLCNGPREGGGFFVAPEADLEDGILEYVMVKNMSRPMMFRLIPELMRGTHGRFKQVRLGRFQKLELSADRPLLIHTDGEIFASAKTDVRDLNIEVLPGALQVIA